MLEDYRLARRVRTRHIVRNRTKIRSEVLKNISKQLHAENISLASPSVRIEQVQVSIRPKPRRQRISPSPL